MPNIRAGPAELAALCQKLGNAPPQSHDLSDADVEREARRLIGEYGADAEAFADMRVMEMLERQDSAGVVAWARILETIQRIQYNESKPS